MVELFVVVLWACIIAIHTRRLVRLTQVEPLLSSSCQSVLRQRLNRAWWWLGREEYWRPVEPDSVRCIQVTFMLFLIALGN
jgi:hypothetical protein